MGWGIRNRMQFFDDYSGIEKYMVKWPSNYTRVPTSVPCEHIPCLLKGLEQSRHGARR